MKIKTLTVAFVILVFALIPNQQCSPAHDKNSQSLQSSVAEQAAFYESEAIKVLTARCLECHSPDSGVQSAISDILDFDTLEADGFIKIGSPQNSPLYIEVVDGFMPPEPANPLSDSEVEMIRLWLLGENLDTDDLSSILIPPDPGNTAPPATYSEVATIIRANCANCHLNGNIQGGVTLNTYTQVMRYVVPNSPAGSRLYGEVQRNEMPPNNPLSATEKQSIYSWVNSGAPNN